MRFKIKGEELDFDEESLTVEESRILKRHSKLTTKQFFLGMRDLDGDAIVGLTYLAKRRAGENPRWSDYDNLNIMKDFEPLGDEDGEGPDDDDLAAAEALESDPT